MIPRPLPLFVYFVALLAFAAQSPKPVQFTNATKAAGIEFVHYKGAKDISTILEEAGPGVCVADFDADGWQDIYFVNGRDRYQRGIETRNALYRNKGDGTFADVTLKAGVDGRGFVCGQLYLAGRLTPKKGRCERSGCMWDEESEEAPPNLRKL